MTRGEVWLTEIGNKSRPVLVMTRPEVIDIRTLVTVAEVSTTVRGLAVEVELDADAVGLSQDSVVNCDGLYTVRRDSLSQRVGRLDDGTMAEVCWAVTHALAC